MESLDSINYYINLWTLSWQIPACSAVYFKLCFPLYKTITAAMSFVVTVMGIMMAQELGNY